MKRDKSIEIGNYLKKAGDSVWYAQQIYKEEGETRLCEVCQDTIDRIVALRLITITLGKEKAE